MGANGHRTLQDPSVSVQDWTIRGGASVAVNERCKAVLVAVALAALATGSGAAVAQSAPPCPGDCNGDNAVTMNELVIGVGQSLGSITLSACPAFDHTPDAEVTIDELLAAVQAALYGCPPASGAFTAAPDPDGPPLVLAPR